MKKEISPDMFNYNKFPGPVFIHFDDIVKSDDIQFKVLANHKDAFDADFFGQRFVEWLLKYDYIVGDWGNEQLRLKGFYKNDRSVAGHLKIARLEDYLKEYCAYGCAYFVLENAEPKELVSDDEATKRRRRKRRRPSSGVKQAFEMTKIERGKRESRYSDDSVPRNRENKQHFTIRKKEN